MKGKFKEMSFQEMQAVHGGWKLFGKETVPAEDNWHSIVGNYSGRSTVTNTYFLGIKVNSEMGGETDGMDT